MRAEDLLPARRPKVRPIELGVPVLEVLVFGSRARGDAAAAF